MNQFEVASSQNEYQSPWARCVANISQRFGLNATEAALILRRIAPTLRRLNESERCEAAVNSVLNILQQRQQ